MKTKSKKLKRIRWDDYIYSCFLGFVLQNSKQTKVRDEIHFQSGVRYSWRQTVNRNPEKVCNHLWEQMLLRHLSKPYN
jgi:hypothetical protein